MKNENVRETAKEGQKGRDAQFSLESLVSAV